MEDDKFIGSDDQVNPLLPHSAWNFALFCHLTLTKIFVEKSGFLSRGQTSQKRQIEMVQAVIDTTPT